MNSDYNSIHEDSDSPEPLPAAALSLVVFRSPGPDDDAIGNHARAVVEACSARPSGGGLGYLTLVESDFDRLWAGVAQGDALGTAYSVLPLLGPGGSQFVGRVDDFMFGWIGHPDEQHGNLLILQIIPRPHLLHSLN